MLAGINVVVDEHGSNLSFDVFGFRAFSGGEYVDRTRLVNAVKIGLDAASRHKPGVLAGRVSVLYQSVIPISDSPYRIEHYIVPRFEFREPEYDFLTSFYHKVEVNLLPLTGSDFYRGVVDD